MFFPNLTHLYQSYPTNQGLLKELKALLLLPVSISDDCAKRILETEVYEQRSRGRPKKDGSIWLKAELGRVTYDSWRRNRGSRWLEKKNLCGYLTPHLRDTQPGGERQPDCSDLNMRNSVQKKSNVVLISDW